MFMTIFMKSRNRLNIYHFWCKPFCSGSSQYSCLFWQLFSLVCKKNYLNLKLIYFCKWAVVEGLMTLTQMKDKLNVLDFWCILFLTNKDWVLLTMSVETSILTTNEGETCGDLLKSFLKCVIIWIHLCLTRDSFNGVSRAEWHLNKNRWLFHSQRRYFRSGSAEKSCVKQN